MMDVFEGLKHLISEFFHFLATLDDSNLLGASIRMFLVLTLILLGFWILPITRRIAAILLHHKYRFFFLWIWKIASILWRAHRNVFENLVKPKNELFSSLKKDLIEQENRLRKR